MRKNCADEFKVTVLAKKPDLREEKHFDESCMLNKGHSPSKTCEYTTRLGPMWQIIGITKMMIAT